MEENKIVLINKEEYYMLKEMGDYKSKYESEYIKNTELRGEIENLKKQLEEEKKNKMHRIQFETYLAIKNPQFYNPYAYSQSKWIDSKYDVVDHIQFLVDTDFVGYERDFIFDSLKKVKEEVVKDVLEKIDEKYNESIKEHCIKHSELQSKYDELWRRVKEYNENHFFHKIDM